MYIYYTDIDTRQAFGNKKEAPQASTGAREPRTRDSLGHLSWVTCPGSPVLSYLFRWEAHGITGRDHWATFEGGKSMGSLDGINGNFEARNSMGSLGGNTGRDHW